jgi:hypothetical protein
MNARNTAETGTTQIYAYSVAVTQELPAGISHVTIQPLLDLPGAPLNLQYFNPTPRGFGKPTGGRLLGIIKSKGGVLLY